MSTYKIDDTTFKVGDRVIAKLWNGDYQGEITKIVGRAIFIGHQDVAGRELCVDIKSVYKLPKTTDIGYATWLH